MPDSNRQLHCFRFQSVGILVQNGLDAILQEFVHLLRATANVGAGSMWAEISSRDMPNMGFWADQLERCSRRPPL